MNYKPSITRVLLFAIVCCLAVAFNVQAQHPVRLGIAWVPNANAYDRVVRSIESNRAAVMTES